MRRCGWKLEYGSWSVVGGLSLASFKAAITCREAYPRCAALFLGCVLDRWRQEATGRNTLYRIAVPLVLALLVGGVTIVWVDRVCRTLPPEEQPIATTDALPPSSAEKLLSPTR